MRVALVDTTPKAKMYPLPLLKIGAWRRSLGDFCVIYNDCLPQKGAFDEIWITTTFTFDIRHALGIVKEAKNRAGRVWVGGVAVTLIPDVFKDLDVDIHLGLLPAAEKFSPDYSLLDQKPEYSISHTSRGCIRKCGFCMVKKVEPKFLNRADWQKDIHPETDKILFYDNNWLAKGFDDLKKDVLKIKALVKSGQIKEVDFNQGLDARLLTKKIAALLKGLPIKPVRFAFDNMGEDGYYQDAVRLMVKNGFREFMGYVLYNYKDSPKDLYYRLREIAKLYVETGTSCKAFPMRYQPILDIDTGRDFTGKKWTPKKKKSFMNIIARHARTGIMCATNIKEFEYWFGKNADEFDRLLSYPKLRQLMARKQGALRIKRKELIFN